MPSPPLPRAFEVGGDAETVACCVGDHDTGRDVVAPLLNRERSWPHHVRPIPYPALQSAFDPLVPFGLQHYWKAEFLPDLTDGVIAVLATYGRPVPHLSSLVYVYAIDGAAGRVGRNDTVFSYRDARYACVIAAMCPDPADTPGNLAWFASTMPPSASTRRARRQLPDGRGPGPGGRRFPRQLPATGRRQDHLRPDQRLPHEPEHPIEDVIDHGNHAVALPAHYPNNFDTAGHLA